MTILLPHYLADTPPPHDNTPLPLPITFDENYTAQVLLSVKTLTVTSNLCDVYKILYYAAVYVVVISACYHKSFLSTISIFNCGHGYAVHSVLASYIIVHVVCTCKQEGGA